MEFAFVCRESLNPSYMVCVSAEGKAARACLMKECASPLGWTTFIKRLV